MELDWAEDLARETLDSLDDESPDNDRILFASNLAYVLWAQDKHDQMLGVLKTVGDAADFSYFEYWFLMGKAYSSLGQQGQAIASFLTSLMFEQELPGFRAALAELGIDDREIASLIEEEKKAAYAFDPGTYSGAGTIGHVVLAELFTGTECRPCVAADLAFDLLADYYPRSSLAILEYHVHIPGADPLTNPHTEHRFQFYGGGFGTPNVFVDGTARIGGGGPALAKKSAFLRYDGRILAALQEDTGLDLRVDAVMRGETISVAVEAQSGKLLRDARLLVALVEKSVDYDQGWNGIKKHAFVVRHLIGDPEGTPLNALEGERFLEETNLGDIEKGLFQYLLDFENNPPERHAAFQGWDVKPVEMNQNNLAVVAWVQNPKSREVYEARYADVEQN